MVPIPHSRVNDVPEAALIDAGYRIVVGTGSSGAGWSVAARQQGDALFVLCQGHPEYGTLSLLREYRRDVRRYLFGRGAVPYPRLPEGYLGEDAVDDLDGLRAARRGDGRGSTRAVVEVPVRRRRRDGGEHLGFRTATLYANWLSWREPLYRSSPEPAMHDETLAIHGGYTADSTRAVAVPIYQTVAHDFVDADHAGAIMDLEIPGFHYNRINNPTVDVLEQRITALEGGAGAMAVSSGAAAVSMSVLNLLGAGDNLVSVPQLYGATYTYFAHVLPTFGIEVRFAADDRPDSIDALIDERTKAVFCETVGNPAGNVIDLAAVAEVAHARGVPVIADNTVATPFLLKPIQHGADVVIHSLTKFVGGHGTTHGRDHHRRRHVPVGRAPGALRQPERA